MKNTKTKLISSVTVLLICFAMLIGSTFAWFTDSASTGVNKIQAGNLDVQLLNENGDSLEGTTLSWKKAPGHETEEVLWEPGCTYELEPFMIKNNGNLKLKYKVMISGINGDAQLNDVITWTYKIGDSDFGLNSENALNPGESSGLITIEGSMSTDAGNQYQGLSIDGISITVMAAQATGEFDSFDDQYDTDATYLNQDEEGNYLISNANELVFFAKSVNVEDETYAGETVKLTDDIDLSGRIWTPVGQTGATQFQGVFDGQGYTISNMTIKNTDTGPNCASGFFGWIENTGNAVITNVKFDNANVTGNHNVGVVVGWISGTISNCEVMNSAVTGINANDDANGDKVGSIVGFINAGTVTGNKVENCTVTANRDAGGVIGAIVSGTTFTNNSVKDTEVYYSEEKSYASAGEIVSGRTGFTPDETNTADNVAVSKLVSVSNANELSNALNKTYTENTMIKLTNDIDLSDISWPACNLSTNSTVIIDGNNKTITGLNATNDYVYGYNAYGLIANISTGNVEIKNLTVSNATVTANQGISVLDAAGIIVGYYMPDPGQLTFTNCKVVNSTVQSPMYAAGLVGYAGGGTQTENAVIINNCNVSNSTFIGGDATGALVALNNHQTKIEGTTITDNIINGGTGYSASALVGTSIGGTAATNVTASGNDFTIISTSYNVYNLAYGYIFNGNGQTYSVNGTELN